MAQRRRPSLARDDAFLVSANDATTCRVKDCCADLSQDKVYCVKKRLCSAHMRANAVEQRGLPNELFRFCFQCGKLEPLSMFDGDARSCRVRLEMRRRPKRASSSQLLISPDASSERGARGRSSSAAAASAPLPACVAPMHAADMAPGAAGVTAKMQLDAASTDGSSSSMQQGAAAAALEQLVRSSTCVSAAAVSSALLGGGAAPPPATPMQRQLSHLQQVCESLRADIWTAAACSSEACLPAAGSSGAAPAAAAAGHLELVQMVVQQLSDCPDSAAAAAQLEADIEKELQAAAALPPGASPPAASLPALQLNAAIEGLSRTISGMSSATNMPAPLCGPRSDPLPRLPSATAATVAAALARQPSAAVSLSAATYSGSGHAAAAPAAAGDMLSEQRARLAALQQQLAQLHGKIGALRGQMQAAA